MCKNTKLKASDSLDDNNTPNSTATASSPSSASTGTGASSSNNNKHSKPANINLNSTMPTPISVSSAAPAVEQTPLSLSSRAPTQTSQKPATTLTKKITYALLWMVLTYISKEFAKYLSIHQSSAAKATFVPASYSYDDENTLFDNTILTYGTDFFIGLVMSYASYQCYTEGKMMTKLNLNLELQGSNSNIPFQLGYKASALFASYAISVFSGAYAHYTYHDVDSMNTLSFRLWWTLCVGTVTIAGGFMGMCGSDICKFFDRNCINNGVNYGNNDIVDANVKRRRFDTIIGYVDIGLWWYYGLFMTVVCIMGEISYKRPACDIFVAGTGQFVPTMYCELMLLSIRWDDAIPKLEASTSTTSSMNTTTATATTTTNAVHSKLVNVPRKVRILYYIGFALNCYLLPGYPLLVQYTNLSLGVVNALLHLNLTFAWGMQAWSLYHICIVVREATTGSSSSSKSSSSSSSSVVSGYALLQGQGDQGCGGGGSIGLQEKKTL